MIIPCSIGIIDCLINNAGVLNVGEFTSTDSLAAENAEMISQDDFAETVYWVYSRPQPISIKDLVIAPTNWEM